MGSKEKRDKALREIVHTWNKIAYRRDWILGKLQELHSKEQKRANIINRIKREKIEEEKELKRAAEEIKSIAKEEKNLSKEIEHWLEQCRLLIRHQQKKIKEFEKNL